MPFCVRDLESRRLVLCFTREHPDGRPKTFNTAIEADVEARGLSAGGNRFQAQEVSEGEIVREMERSRRDVAAAQERNK